MRLDVQMPDLKKLRSEFEAEVGERSQAVWARTLSENEIWEEERSREFEAFWRSEQECKEIFLTVFQEPSASCRLEQTHLGNERRRRKVHFRGRLLFLPARFQEVFSRIH